MCLPNQEFAFITSTHTHTHPPECGFVNSSVPGWARVMLCPAACSLCLRAPGSLTRRSAVTALGGWWSISISFTFHAHAPPPRPAHLFPAGCHVSEVCPESRGWFRVYPREEDLRECHGYASQPRCFWLWRSLSLQRCLLLQPFDNTGWLFSNPWGARRCERSTSLSSDRVLLQVMLS